MKHNESTNLAPTVGSGISGDFGDERERVPEVATDDRSPSPRKEDGPPFANRGVDNPPYIIPNNVLGCSVDWLTASIDTVTASNLCEITDIDQVGGSRPGFKSSQLRAYPGGKVWRRFDPRQPSKKYGLAYESWEWSGDSSPWGASYLRKHEARPSRVDICFNLAVPPTLTADQVLEDARHHFEKQGLTDGISGHGGINTRYIGSKASPRRIRIYRKDKQDQAWAHLHGPTIRIELEMKDEHARNWWKVWIEDDQKAYRVGAGHIRQMSGYELMDVEDVPELVRVEQAAPAALLATFIKQNGASIQAYSDAGIDVLALAKQKVDASSSVCRSWMKAKRIAVLEAGVREVQALASDLLKSNPINHLH